MNPRKLIKVAVEKGELIELEIANRKYYSNQEKYVNCTQGSRNALTHVLLQLMKLVTQRKRVAADPQQRGDEQDVQLNI